MNAMNAKDIIKDRAEPTYLAKSEDPSRRLPGRPVVSNNPMIHSTTIYAKGSNRPHGQEGLTDEEIRRL